ncbi:MAG: DNA recombination protein RmuC, partial [Phycisphaerae bacterium]|nr:DNA recombination protein RmuC [Phycisphaerae bacterium]
MELWQILTAALAGFVLGVLFFKLISRQRQIDKSAILQAGKEAFASLSQEALSRNVDELLKHARSQNEIGAKNLESKKALIDQALEQMSSRLEGVKTLVQGLDKDRAQKFGELTKQLQLAGEQTTELTRTTDSLRKALAGGKSRGQWGERMAE